LHRDQVMTERRGKGEDSIYLLPAGAASVPGPGVAAGILGAQKTA
jgi:hypothetical protein